MFRVFTLLTCCSIASVSAEDLFQFSYSGGMETQEFDLTKTIKKTGTRTVEVEGTCDEVVTRTENQCSTVTRNREECSTVPGEQICTPQVRQECRDITSTQRVCENDQCEDVTTIIPVCRSIESEECVAQDGTRTCQQIPYEAEECEDVQVSQTIQVACQRTGEETFEYDFPIKVRSQVRLKSNISEVSPLDFWFHLKDQVDGVLQEKMTPSNLPSDLAVCLLNKTSNVVFQDDEQGLEKEIFYSFEVLSKRQLEESTPDLVISAKIKRRDLKLYLNSNIRTSQDLEGVSIQLQVQREDRPEEVIILDRPQDLIIEIENQLVLKIPPSLFDRSKFRRGDYKIVATARVPYSCKGPFSEDFSLTARSSYFFIRRENF